MELSKRVEKASIKILNKYGFIAPVELLKSMTVLSDHNYQDWRFGKVPFLEKVCKVNLVKLSIILKELERFGMKNDLKPSFTAYVKWGNGQKKRLRFSKSGDANLERAYATHYVRVAKNTKPLRYNEEDQKTDG